MPKFICLFLLFFPFNAFASSCEKNQTCKNRFEIQNDPIDFKRESSRAHIATFFILNTATNRYLESDHFKNWSQLELTKNQRILSSFLLLTGVGLIKEFVYDPDGLSRSDMANNTLGLVLSASFEWSFF